METSTIVIRLYLCCIIICIITGCGFTKPRGDGAGANYTPSNSGLSQLRVSGNTIINVAGTPIILQGINAIDPLKQSTDIHNYQGAGPFNETYFATMASWGANVVRLPIHPENWRTTSNAAALAIIDQAVTWAKNNNMYIIIDFHTIGMLSTGVYEITTYNNYTTDISEVQSYWQTIATHYKNEPAVAAYEIFNEPINFNNKTNMADWATWKTDAETIINTIRAIDQQKIVIVG